VPKTTVTRSPAAATKSDSNSPAGRYFAVYFLVLTCRLNIINSADYLLYYLFTVTAISSMYLECRGITDSKAPNSLWIFVHTFLLFCIKIKNYKFDFYRQCILMFFYCGYYVMLLK